MTRRAVEKAGLEIKESAKAIAFSTALRVIKRLSVFPLSALVIAKLIALTPL
jgi:hypothetical protein